MPSSARIIVVVCNAYLKRNNSDPLMIFNSDSGVAEVTERAPETRVSGTRSGVKKWV